MQINRTMSLAISITTPNTTDADHCTDGGSASAPTMLRQVNIMSPLLLRTESFTICPAPQKKRNKRKEHQQSDFQKKPIKNQLNSQSFNKKKLWKINPIDQKLQHCEVMIGSSR
jgi:hypothetical protein